MKDRLIRSLELNSMIARRRKDGFFDLAKDEEAIEEYEKYVDENFGTDLRGIEKIR